MRLDLALNPQPLERARVVIEPGRRAHAYTPERSDQFATDFRWMVKGAGARPLSGPLRLVVRFWRRCRGSARGDLDNLVKAVGDAGNGFLWDDDEQIIELDARLEAWGPKVSGRIVIEVDRLAKEASK